MELNQLKEVFDAGSLKSAVITLAAMQKGYNVLFINTKDKAISMTAQRSVDESPRVFKTLDAAAASIEKVGFKKIQITL